MNQINNIAKLHSIFQRVLVMMVILVKRERCMM
jgi:hypothetical protein